MRKNTTRRRSSSKISRLDLRKGLESLAAAIDDVTQAAGRDDFNPKELRSALRSIPRPKRERLCEFLALYAGILATAAHQELLDMESGRAS